jgi:hypothetical protein
VAIRTHPIVIRYGGFGIRCPHAVRLESEFAVDRHLPVGGYGSEARSPRLAPLRDLVSSLGISGLVVRQSART